MNYNSELNKAIEDGDLSFLNSSASVKDKCIFLNDCYPMLPKNFLVKYIQKHPELKDWYISNLSKINTDLISILNETNILNINDLFALADYDYVYAFDSDKFYQGILNLDSTTDFDMLWSKLEFTKLSILKMTKIQQKQVLLALSKNDNIKLHRSQIYHTIHELFLDYSNENFILFQDIDFLSEICPTIILDNILAGIYLANSKITTEQLNIIKPYIPIGRFDYIIYLWEHQPHLRDELRSMFIERLKKVNYNKYAVGDINITIIGESPVNFLKRIDFPHDLIQMWYDKLKQYKNNREKEQTMYLKKGFTWLKQN